MNKVNLCGVTGSIGSGKSTVAKMFESLHCIKIYNCDDEFKDYLVYKPDVKKEIISFFGQDSYVDGKYNIPKFRNLLFTDKISLNKMNDIILPYLIQDIHEWKKNINGLYILIECATLFESKLYKHFNKNIIVTAPLDIRINRLLNRGLTFEDIQNRMRSQMSDDKKMFFADYEIINDHNDENLITQTNFIHKELFNEFWIKGKGLK